MIKTDVQMTREEILKKIRQIKENYCEENSCSFCGSYSITRTSYSDGDTGSGVVRFCAVVTYDPEIDWDRYEEVGGKFTYYEACENAYDPESIEVFNADEEEKVVERVYRYLRSRAMKAMKGRRRQ